MKKIAMIALTAAALVTLGTGCSTIYSALGTNKEEVREYTTAKIQAAAIAYADKKIDAREDLTDEKKAALKEEAKDVIEKAFVKVKEFVAKAEAAKAAKAAAKAAETSDTSGTGTTATAENAAVTTDTSGTK